MALEKVTKVTRPSGRVPKKKVFKKVVPTPVSTKIVQNVSLQTWSVPTGTKKGLAWLSPGATITIPASAITERLINLRKRKLISIR